ncbi:polysaccharide lyase family protein [Wenjunlia tyrosinilytica]|uniref:Enoyl reductase (ER) domain-containing protein n=1 Tax=Wenjunlia tyrosinilytica TaxID=1544741 RepID=A0A918E2D3_9ACTN|nr:polysaccharide lyase family protein [Wenjunlia tyrosinilytica]GGO99020.1 hypothetical protein GCM10012280_64520 [Wenjunlia tyrosinilytica]
MHTRAVTVAAGDVTTVHTITINGDPAADTAIWRIGDWNGTPVGFKNASLVTYAHPSDSRAAAWTADTYVIGRSTPSAWSAYQFKEIVQGLLTSFTLAAAQAAADRTPRIGITTAKAGGRPQVTVNDTWTSAIPAAAAEPSTRSLAVGSYRGNNHTCEYVIPGAQLLSRHQHPPHRRHQRVGGRRGPPQSQLRFRRPGPALRAGPTGARCAVAPARPQDARNVPGPEGEDVVLHLTIEILGLHGGAGMIGVCSGAAVELRGCHVRAYGFKTNGGPEVEEVQVPTPAPGPGQVLIEVAYAGVNFAEVQHRRGEFGEPDGPGGYDVPGLEVSGTVAALGSGARGPAVGEQVAAYLPAFGGYAEFVVADTDFVRPVSGLPLAHAAGVPCVYPTAYGVLADAGRLRDGETVLIHGTAGGVGSAAARTARALGAARVFGTVGSPEKAQLAAALGYDALFARDDFLDAVREATGSRGVDLVLDPVGRRAGAAGESATPGPLRSGRRLRGPRASRGLDGGRVGSVEEQPEHRRVQHR